MPEKRITSHVIVHGEGLAQFTRAQLEETLGTLGLQVTIPMHPAQVEGLQKVIDAERGFPLPVRFSEDDFRRFASVAFTPAVIGKAWGEIRRLGVCFPLTPKAITTGRALEYGVAFFYPSSLLEANEVPSYEQGFKIAGASDAHAELLAASLPDAISVKKLTDNGFFGDQPQIGGRSIELLQQFCDHVLSSGDNNDKI